MEQQWTINYIRDEGRLTGHLIVRDDEIAFKGMYDSSFKTIAKNIGLAVGSLGATGGHLAYLRDNGDEAEIVIPTASISRAEAAKKGMMKRVVVHLDDGSQHVFEYGLLSVKKLVSTINEAAGTT